MNTTRRSIRVEDALPRGWAALFSLAHPKIGIGVDLGTTTNEKSNPSAVAVTQLVGLMHYVRLVLRFKASDPAILRAILLLILEGLREQGLSARRCCIDATNERFFAVDLRRDLAGKVPVELIINSEKTTYGGEAMLWKAYLVNLGINTIEDGYLALPGGKWLQIDLRQTVKDRGTFYSDVLADGGHADCHRAIENSLHAVVAKGGPVEAQGAPLGNYGSKRGQAPADARRDVGRLSTRGRQPAPRRAV